MLKVSKLYIYPIKSLRGISRSSCEVSDRGLQYDRRWMIIDNQNRFLTQREYPKMTLIKVELKKDALFVQSLENEDYSLIIPFHIDQNSPVTVGIWNAEVEAKRVGRDADQWFSDLLGVDCKLVYMPDQSMRPVDTTSGFAPEGKFTSFADAYPFMMLGEASMEDLNSRMSIPLTINRFRPNIVFSGGTPYQEDDIEDFSINGIHFTGLENCARCMIPTVDPDLGIFNKDREPLKTLSRYRMRNRKIEFGRNVVHQSTGRISVGDELKLRSEIHK